MRHPNQVQEPNPHRDQLIAWIARTRRMQRRLVVVVVALAVMAFGLGSWRADVGTLALISTVLVGLSGFWITSSHISEWRSRLARLG